MKKLLLYILTLSIFINDTNATKINDSTSTNPPIISVLVDKNKNIDEIVLRLKEIEQMDPNSLNKLEKENLRKEVVAINKEIKNARGGIYLSVGAIIIILLLIVLL